MEEPVNGIMPKDRMEKPPATTPDSTYEELAFPDNTLDTSDWETYKPSSFDNNIAFEIRYPRNWKIQSHGEKQAGPNATMVLYDKRIGHGADNGIYMVVEIIPIEQYVSESTKSSEYRKIKAGTVYGYALSDEAQKNFSASSALSDVIFGNTKGNRTYTFRIIGPDLKNPSDPDYYLDVLEQILLSFKLTP